MSQSVKAPFKFSYTQPSLDWFETINVEIKPDDYCYFKLQRRYGTDWWLIGQNPPPENSTQREWSETELGRISCREGQKPGTTVVLLIPARTDRASFHDYILGKAEIRFLRGRLKFELDGKPMGTAPFPSMIAIWRGGMT